MRHLLLPLALLSTGALALRTLRQRLLAQPDRYPEQRLREEPKGTEVQIERPDGTRLRAISAGQGPTVVLAHGFGASVLEWNIVWDGLLAAGYRVVCFDQRGHEKSTIGSDGVSTSSMAGDYLAVLERFGVEDGFLIGHSMGGFLAIAAVLEQPGVAARLRGLVLFATFAGRILQGAPQNWLQIPLLEHQVLQKLIASETAGLLFGASLAGARPSPAESRVFMDLFRRQDHRQLVPVLRALGQEDRYARLGEIDVPTVVICGRQDRTTPPWHSTRLAAGIPGARLVWVDGAGHLLNWEAPESLIEAVAELASRPKRIPS
ncbi:alpha/beta hydrolase [Sorangium sp. So ce281]|uniref:alpha/beta fold hydrolase n=1 Tax=unclassified Sorangium TaxID=2621164 RepID=UPI003F5DBEE3